MVDWLVMDWSGNMVASIVMGSIMVDIMEGGSVLISWSLLGSLLLLLVLAHMVAIIVLMLLWAIGIWTVARVVPWVGLPWASLPWVVAAVWSTVAWVHASEWRSWGWVSVFSSIWEVRSLRMWGIVGWVLSEGRRVRISWL